MSSTNPQAGANRSLTRSLWVMVAGSFVFGFALVPLYDVICEAAGIRLNAAPVLRALIGSPLVSEPGDLLFWDSFE